MYPYIKISLLSKQYYWMKNSIYNHERSRKIITLRLLSIKVVYVLYL